MADPAGFLVLIDVIKNGGPWALAIVFATLYWRADQRERLSLGREHRLAIQGIEAMVEINHTLDKLGAKKRRQRQRPRRSKR